MICHWTPANKWTSEILSRESLIEAECLIANGKLETSSLHDNFATNSSWKFARVALVLHLSFRNSDYSSKLNLNSSPAGQICLEPWNLLNIDQLHILSNATGKENKLKNSVATDRILTVRYQQIAVSSHGIDLQNFHANIVFWILYNYEKVE